MCIEKDNESGQDLKIYMDLNGSIWIYTNRIDGNH